ncbi:hypothetical protein [Burkholderia sp. AU38729]|uniref:hypothetical protein n=1 Tax=Burkholderia sp. AU38729 TaxID=2879633 RepID=UPI001CF43CFB|nr:hypothetical protein [Burkholderia sp. AU38729]MCA8067311.1 hypothetical protein [Burkholderia sp. AU38729]
MYDRTNTTLAVCEGVDRASVEAAPPLRIRDKNGLVDIRYPEGAVQVPDPSTAS